MIPPKTFGAALRVVRTEKGFSQVEAAKAAGLALTVLNRAETGKSLLSMNSLFAFLDGVGAELRDLAHAIDVASGRVAMASPGRPNARWVAALSGRPLDEDRLFGFAAGVLDPEDAQAREDFVASVETVAGEMARRVVVDLDQPAKAR